MEDSPSTSALQFLSILPPIVLAVSGLTLILTLLALIISLKSTSTKLKSTLKMLALANVAIVFVALFFTATFTFGPRHTRLSSQPNGANSESYRQLKEPTKAEQQNGQKALKDFKTADQLTRSRLAEDLVLGRTLIGMTKSQVTAALGEVKNDFGDTLNYNTCTTEKWCVLVVYLEQDKVQDAQINCRGD